MKLYLLAQDDNNEYDTFDSCVVCAESEEDAKTISPNFGGGEPFVEDVKYTAWAKKASSISCVEIGVANENQKRGVILASYNAG